MADLDVEKFEVGSVDLSGFGAELLDDTNLFELLGFDALVELDLLQDGVETVVVLVVVLGTDFIEVFVGLVSDADVSSGDNSDSVQGYESLFVEDEHL